MTNLTKFSTAVFAALTVCVTVIQAQDIWIGPPGPGPNNNWFNNNNWQDGSVPTGGDTPRSTIPAPPGLIMRLRARTILARL